MTSSIRIQINTLWYLFFKNYITFKPYFFDKVINALIWATLNIIVFGYIMQAEGLQNFGPFILVTTAGSNAFWTAYNNCASMISDLNGDTSHLQYELTLPIYPWLVFVKYALTNAFQGLATSIFILPIGLPMLRNQFDYQHLCLSKFIISMIIGSIFSGFFGLWFTSIMKDLTHDYENLFIRLIFPLWFLGGYQFSWKHLLELSPILAYANLLNPLTYMLEGVRASALDPKLFLNFWLCMLALIFFSVVFGAIAIRNLKKRVDCL